MTSPSPQEAGTGEDRCPGVLRLHPAADGLLARVRVPGGRLDPGAWRALAAAAVLGDGALHLTSRGNVQIRGLAAESRGELARVLAEGGLAPSEAHDRARNILASPMAGRLPGHGELGGLVSGLHAELLSRPSLAALSGRFSFGLDDGGGDILRLRPDLGARWTPEAPRGGLELLVAGAPTGLRVADHAVPRLLADLADRAVAHPALGWRLDPAGPETAAVLDAARAHEDVLGGAHPGGSEASGQARDPSDVRPTEHEPVGWIEAIDGSVSLLAVTPFGVLDARLAEFLGAIETETTLSPERVIGIHGLTEGQAEQVVRVLAPMGLVFDAASPWVGSTACAGAGACASARRDVRGDLADAVRRGEAGVRRQHWVACERACGWDHEAELHVGDERGYTITTTSEEAR